MFQSSVLDKELSKENLENRAALYGISGNTFKKRLDYLVELLDFGDFLKRPVGSFRRTASLADIVRAPSTEPKILIPDEPTTGPRSQTRAFCEVVVGDCAKRIT